MCLMSTLIIFCGACIQSRRKSASFFCGQTVKHGGSNVLPIYIRHRRRKLLLGLVPGAKRGDFSKKKKPWWAWWQDLFLEDRGEGRWLSTDEEDLLADGLHDDEEVSEEDQEARNFEAWRRRAEAITELQEAEEDARNMDSRAWGDWISESELSVDNTVGASWEQGSGGSRDEEGSSNYASFPEEGLIRTIRDLFLRSYDDDLLFEDRVFKYASINSAKFLAILVLVPWVVDFAVHDYIMMPFLDTYVKTVPLASKFFDVRRNQKLQMIKVLNLEKARYRFEVEIGKAPPVSDDEEWLELRNKAIELRDEWRLENRKAFANIWSDMVYGITLFLLVYFNQSRVALLKFTGYKLFNNISDTGKAFLIILITDIALGYHSESGWEALIESILEHYGLEIDHAAITIFICFVPVVIDACVKLWLFKFLPRISPNVTNIFREMKRH